MVMIVPDLFDWPLRRGKITAPCGPTHLLTPQAGSTNQRMPRNCARQAALRLIAGHYERLWTSGLGVSLKPLE